MIDHHGSSLGAEGQVGGIPGLKVDSNVEHGGRVVSFRNGHTDVVLPLKQILHAEVIILERIRMGERLQISYPEPDSAFWDNQGNFTLRLTLEPALDSAAGHRVRVYLDGEPRGTTSNLQWRFTGVNRGTHSVRAEVIDEAGESLIQSETVSFHLHQQSVNLPARKANP